MKILFLPSATQEFLDVVDFYDYQSPKLGFAFKEEFFEAVDFIQIFPRG